MIYRGLFSVSRGYPRPRVRLTTCYWAVCLVLLQWLAWLSTNPIAVRSGRINRIRFVRTLVRVEVRRNIYWKLVDCTHFLQTSDKIFWSNPHVVCVTGGLWITNWYTTKHHHKRRLAVTYAKMGSMRNNINHAQNLIFLQFFFRSLILNRLAIAYNCLLHQTSTRKKQRNLPKYLRDQKNFMSMELVIT